MTFPDADWFKTTVPGIIVLGAVGSILAVFILKFALWGARSFFRTTLRHFFGPLLRSYVLHQYFRRRYQRRADPRDLIGYLIWLATCVVLSTIIFFVFLATTIFYFALRGPVLSPALFGLVTFTFLSFYFWFSDLLAFTGANEVILRDIIPIRRRLKRIGVTGRLAKKLNAISTNTTDA